MSRCRPEHQAPPELYYGETEAAKYTCNSHIISVQTQLTERALELLNLPADTSCLLLDIGCGSGLSGDVLDAHGHFWVGLDVSPAMLDVAVERGVDGDLVLADAGALGAPFRPGSFDGVVSISMLQWLCNADERRVSPQRRLARFFESLYAALARGARAVFQFYPENEAQLAMINGAASRAGFTGGVVVDYPNSTRAKKVYLCLMAGGASFALPSAIHADAPEKESAGARFESKRIERARAGGTGKGAARPRVKSKEWIQSKKESMRKRGDKKVAHDSKYTGRKRGPKF